MFNLFRRKLTYKCHCCGESYEGSPSFAYLKPDEVFDVPEDEYEARVKLDSDLCHIKAGTGLEQDLHLIRVTLDIPIRGAKEPFCWGVWVTQSKESFWRYVETFNQDQTGTTSFGWLTVRLPHYNRSGPSDYLENLACDVHWHSAGQRPKIVLHQCDHPLYHDQQTGISWEEAVRIAQGFLKSVH